MWRRTMLTTVMGVLVVPGAALACNRDDDDPRQCGESWGEFYRRKQREAEQDYPERDWRDDDDDRDRRRR